MEPQPEAPPVFSAVAPGWDEVHFAGDAPSVADVPAPTSEAGRPGGWRRWQARESRQDYRRFEEEHVDDAAEHARRADAGEEAMEATYDEDKAQASMPAVLQPTRRAAASLRRQRRYEALAEEQHAGDEEGDDVAMLHAHTG